MRWKSFRLPLPSWLTLKTGDLTLERVDGVVNAANKFLQMGGGVDGAIHRAAGSRELKAACEAVGPRWGGGAKGEAKLLASAYTDSLRIAALLGCRSVAFPAISCGVFGYPFEEAVLVSRRAIEAFQAGPLALKDVRLVYADEVAEAVARAVWAQEAK